MSESKQLPRRKRRRLVPVLACILGLVLAACSGTTGSQDEEDTSPVSAETGDPNESIPETKIEQLSVGVKSDVSTLDNTKRCRDCIYIQPLLMESLLTLDSNGELQPWLATEWEQVNETVYEYTLREGVTFWDGTELTSADVKYSWEYYARPESIRADFFSSMESIDTPDERTVRVTLKEPDASWQFVPAMWYSMVIQKEFAEQHEDTFGEPGTLVMGTGPWQIESLNPTSGAELSAYADHWGGEPPIDNISFTFYSDENSMGLALRAGEIDLAPRVLGPDGFDAAAGGGTVTTVPTCATALLSMPTQTEPWNDVHVRRAVAHAVNRDDIVAATQGRAGGPLEYLISPILLQSLGTDDEVEAALEEVTTYPHDLEAAKEEMAQSTVPDGFNSTLKIIPSRTAIVEVIAAQVGEIGIDLEIEVLEDAAWYSEISGPPEDRPLTFSETGACTPDPSWNEIWIGSDALLNVANWAPDDVDQLLDAGRATQDPKERLEIYTDLLKRLAEDVPYLPLYAEGATYASTEYDILEYDSYWFSAPWALNVVPT